MAHGMMLRASIEMIGAEIDIRAITDPSVDSLVDGGALLLEFVDAVAAGDEGARGPAAAALASGLGDAALVDAAGAIGTFAMMNRIADATGMPVGKGTLQQSEEFRALTGVDRFRHS